MEDVKEHSVEGKKIIFMTGGWVEIYFLQQAVEIQVGCVHVRRHGCLEARSKPHSKHGAWRGRLLIEEHNFAIPSIEHVHPLTFVPNESVDV